MFFRAVLIAALASLGPTAQSKPAVAPAKDLPMPGEVFEVDGHTAFLILPPKPRSDRPVPWVLYAPTLPGLPSAAETWMFERFLAAGIAIAGIDVGESYGSPAGRALYAALYENLVGARKLAPRACLLARSRGGLMLYNWAAEHPDAVACIAGIYPVCDLQSYPGIAKACAAYAMTEAELRDALREHNPIERLAPLAAAHVPILHLHGEDDSVVPLATNSRELARRYAALHGPMVLKVFAGHGHDMWNGWFQSEELVKFVIRHACPDTTKGILVAGDLGRPDDAVQLVGPEASVLLPEDPAAACLWVFADGILCASPKWDSVVTPQPYRDFRLHVEFNVNQTSGDDHESRGNSGVYIQQRYEVQILDSFGIDAKDYTASDCGSLYRLRKPDRIVNKPAGEWQCFDIVFRAARYDGDAKVEDARITVWQNEQPIHDDVAIPRKTGAGKPEGPEPLPIKLQGHHNEVRFRNVWVQVLDLDARRPQGERQTK
ncbi:MAG: family 16 glycoside hydrolase [Planctomycetota bacterium]